MHSKKTKKIYLIIFLLIVLIVFVFSFVTFNKKEQLSSKELKYEQIIKKINAKENQDLTDIEEFIIENKNIYGTLSSLYLAKKYVLNDKLDKAFIQLNNSLEYTKEENLRNILKIRMAKIKIQQKKHSEAMNILNEIKDENWTSIVENMKGDIFIQDKKIKKAKSAWEKSKLLQQSVTSQEIINMKINQIKNK